MKRNWNENLPRPTAGCLPVPLFNQKKRNRLPLTSNPSENEFCSSHEFSPSERFPSSMSSGISGNSGFSQVHTPSQQMSAVQNSQWSRRENLNSIPAENSAARIHAPFPHRGKPVNMGPQTGQQRSTLSHDCIIPSNTKKSSFPTKRDVWSKTNPSHSYLQTGQSCYRQSNSPACFPLPPPQRYTPGVQDLNSTRQFKEDHIYYGSTNNTPKQQVSSILNKVEVLRIKPVKENSLRILTAVIEGMKHWSQYKDRVPFLFEIFATLDSAVTVGHHGAKNFLLRDGKDVLQCVFYENDQDLPRLIRGQVQRCVGNYDKEKDLLTCVSVRHASPSEQRNAKETVTASDAEMRRLIQSLREV